MYAIPLQTLHLCLKKSQPSPEEVLDALDIPVEVELGLPVGHGDHLGEIDDDGIGLVVDHDVELIEVAVDDTVVGELQQQRHQFVIQVWE